MLRAYARSAAHLLPQEEGSAHETPSLADFGPPKSNKRLVAHATDVGENADTQVAMSDSEKESFIDSEDRKTGPRLFIPPSV